MIVYTMEAKENFSRNQVFCISLADELRKFIHPSLDVYIAKNSGRIHLTSRVDLDCLRFQILDLVNITCFIAEFLNIYLDRTLILFSKKVINTITFYLIMFSMNRKFN